MPAKAGGGRAGVDCDLGAKLEKLSRCSHSSGFRRDREYLLAPQMVEQVVGGAREVSMA